MTTPKEIVEQFWKTMATNDFNAAGRLLHPDFILEWPQSGERIKGPDNFAAMNENYPSNGAWKFTIHKLIAEENQVVSDVSVTDGNQNGRAITFSTVCDGKIIYQAEFWPDPFLAPDWRRNYVEPAKT